ncbi:hypothetical protein KEM56_001255, partial [Ascosphaera pollenicola]
MYWPNGVPRVYTVNGPGIKLPRIDDHAERRPKRSPRSLLQDAGEGAAEQPVEEEKEEETEVTSSPSTSDALQTMPLSRREREDRKHAKWAEEPIIGLSISRHGRLFATMTLASIVIWQTRPTAVVAAVKRSERSLSNYGPNVSLHLSPDSTILVIQTILGYLITYSIATDGMSRIYRQRLRRDVPRRNHLGRQISVGEENGLPDVSIRFRVVIKIDSGITKALALEQEIILSTVGPSAVQLIRWTPDESGNQS